MTELDLHRYEAGFNPRRRRGILVAPGVSPRARAQNNQSPLQRATQNLIL
jgi:hypothetical protein